MRNSLCLDFGGVESGRWDRELVCVLFVHANAWERCVIAHSMLNSWFCCVSGLGDFSTCESLLLSETPCYIVVGCVGVTKRTARKSSKAGSEAGTSNARVRIHNTCDAGHQTALRWSQRIMAPLKGVLMAH